MAIKYNVGGLNREMQRTVKNFNAKVRRLEQKGHKLTPQTISMKDLREGYNTRTELKRALKRYQSFSAKGAEDIITTEGGVELTQYEFKNIKADIKRAKMNVTRSINAINKPTRYPMMVSEQIIKLERTQEDLSANFKKLGRSDFKGFNKKLQNYLGKLTRNEEFYNKFFEMLFADAFVAGVDKEVLNQIETKLRRLTPNKLYDLYTTTPELKAIVESYDLFVSNINIKKDFNMNKKNRNANYTGDFEKDLFNIANGTALTRYDDNKNNLFVKLYNLNSNLDRIIDDYNAG